MKRPGAGGIPKEVSASKALSAHQRFSGAVPLAQLPRLAGQLADPSGELRVDLEAVRDRQGTWLRGGIRGKFNLTCQRGLHPFPWRCDLKPSLRLVTSEVEEQRVLKDCEPYLIEDDRLPLRDLVEDEVLLALPMMPRCDDPTCLERLGRPSGRDKSASTP